MSATDFRIDPPAVHHRAGVAAARVVGILGGMGPAAGADFVRLFVSECEARMKALGLRVCDQAYPEHWLAQLPIADRTAALLDESRDAQQPDEQMLQVLGRLAALGVRGVAVACNTAHAWHGRLQQRFPQLQVLHCAQETATALQAVGARRVAVLATTGTLKAQIYPGWLQRAGIECHVPQPAEQQVLMRGIYDGVKAGNPVLARSCFVQVARSMAQRHAVCALVLACTEIPLALAEQDLDMDGVRLINPAEVLARALARYAYQDFAH